MPIQNHFRPQRYSTDPPTANYELIEPNAPLEFESPEVQKRMLLFGNKLEQAQVRRIVLVHGTLAGTDALGILGHVDQFLPDVAQSLGGLRKRLVDSVIGDVGNYSLSYLEQFANSIEQSDIPVSRFLWSSENHHLGRARAAVNLLGELFAIDLQPNDRILLWGHSHAGNVFAIASNLIGGDDADREGFFAALLQHAPPSADSSDAENCDAENDDPAEIARSVRQRMTDTAATKRLAQALDFVTFGTPIRYGWDTEGCRSLLHFVNHHPEAGVPKWQAKYPQYVEEIGEALLGVTGDYVQQTFIAGTDFSPSIMNRNARRANTALGELLEPGTRRRDLLKRLRTGSRVAADGTTLLVDYGAASENAADGSEVGARQLAGHGVYTTLAWLPFHLNKVVQRIYG